MKKGFALALCMMLVLAVLPTACFAAPDDLNSDFEKYIIEQLKDEASAIDVNAYRIASEEISDIYFDILYRNPELFYVDRYLEYSYIDQGRVTVIEPVYLYTGQERLIKSAQYEMLVEKAVNYALSASTVVGQLMLVNDYFCVNYEYDIKDEIHDPYTLLMEKKGVCEAYALAFGAVMDRLAIPSKYVMSEKMEHAWNMVEVDGEWYHIDVTWNDPVEDLPLRARHDNFLRSDAAMKENGYYGWETDVVAESTKYDDAFWIAQKTPIPVFKDHLIYADAKPDKEDNRTIYAWDPVTDVTRNIGFSSASGFDGTGKYAEGYIALFTYGGNLYYSSAESIYMLNADGTSTHVYSNTDTSQMIWSAWVQNDDLFILTGEDLKEDSKVKTLLWE